MGIRTRRAHNHAKTHIVGFGAAALAGFIALAVIALAASMGSIVDGWLQDLPDYNNADAYLVSEPSQVYDDKDQLIAEFYSENRRAVNLDEISPYVLTGTVDTEDIRFYQHNGVDPQGIARALVVQITGGSEGASTITQQLVRNTVLSDEQFERSLKRKVREAYIAIEMEKKYDKQQILNMYLNTIYYGSSAYGIEAAAKTYFNKDAKDLTLPEAALLVGIPNSPSLYDPTVNPDAALQRRNLVLKRMHDAGDITDQEYQEAVDTPLELHPGQNVMDQSGTYPYWSSYIKSLLSEDFSSETVMKGGLKVHTTLDPDNQKAAEDAVNQQLDSIGQEDLTAALVAIDPNTGYIKAMVGGRDFNKNQFNNATQAKRQPGSSFKAITLTAAISEGMNPNILLNCSSPMQITNSWRVQNYGNHNYGTITLARATELSSNTGYAQVAQAIGAEKIVETAHEMGITADLPAYPSITLGTIVLPPVQMAEAYATLASGGVHHDAVAITKIEDRNGNVVYEHKDSSKQTIDPSVAYAATQVLEGVVSDAGATGINVSRDATIDQPIAGKTGTTEYARDLWFCGYTPQIACAVWVGYQEEKTVYVHGAEGSPGTTACPIFANYLNRTLDGLPREEFKEAEAPDYKPNSSWSFSKGSGGTKTETTETPKTQTPEETTVPETPQEDTSTVPQETPTPTPEAPTTSGGNGGDGNGGTSGGDTGNQGGTTPGGDTGGGDTGGTTPGGDTGGGDTGGTTPGGGTPTPQEQ